MSFSRWRNWTAASVLLLAAMSQPALAHPHILIDAKLTVGFDAQGRIESLRNSWTFDSAFSVWMVQGLDTDGGQHSQLRGDAGAGRREHGRSRRLWLLHLCRRRRGLYAGRRPAHDLREQPRDARFQRCCSRARSAGSAVRDRYLRSRILCRYRHCRSRRRDARECSSRLRRNA
ncbi:DUF1007 family protein [Devosia chinhatensis]|uniref:DUF1007 family protein n=1 Tax=Devosia aurantiaca TaxID=2714858 RepID=A0A6M1SM84_9HYPH|nr:DUF1007 family protein [Devosia aurantiaca]